MVVTGVKAMAASRREANNLAGCVEEIRTPSSTMICLRRPGCSGSIPRLLLQVGNQSNLSASCDYYPCKYPLCDCDMDNEVRLSTSPVRVLADVIVSSNGSQTVADESKRRREQAISLTGASS